MNELKEPKSYGVNKLHNLTAYRYPALESDCTALALEYKDFAEKFLR
jgi:hypothetical protein